MAIAALVWLGLSVLAAPPGRRADLADLSLRRDRPQADAPAGARVVRGPPGLRRAEDRGLPTRDLRAALAPDGLARRRPGPVALGPHDGRRARRDHLSPASRERGGGPPRASLRRPAAVLDLRHRRGHRQRTAHRPPAAHAARGHPSSPARASRMAGGPDRVGPHRRGDGQAADRGALSLARALPAAVVAARVAGGDRLRSTDPLRAVLPGGHTGRNDPRPALEERGVRRRQRARQRVEPPCLAGDAGAADVDLPRVAARVAGARLLDPSPPGRRSLGSAGGRRDRGLLLDLPSVVRRRAAAAADGGAVPDGEAWVRRWRASCLAGRSCCRWRPAGFSCCRHR